MVSSKEASRAGVHHFRPAISSSTIHRDRDAEGSIDGLSDEDQTAVLQLFKLAADAAAELAPELQIIIMDHADLKPEWFATAVIERWRKGEKLIPASWLQ